MTIDMTLRPATADDVIAKLKDDSPIYASTAETALGWGMGPAQINITAALDAAIATGRVRVVDTRDTTYGRGIRMVAYVPQVTCQWRGIFREGITGTCDREATLSGQNVSSGIQHLCTEHMRARNEIGCGAYSYTWVWPCQKNGFVLSLLPGDTVVRELPSAAARLCR
jgi:hypothetical protein